jgi:hypothetical protein
MKFWLAQKRANLESDTTTDQVVCQARTAQKKPPPLRKSGGGYQRSYEEKQKSLSGTRKLAAHKPSNT